MASRARESSAKCSTIQLPNIPKMTDDKSRVKYMTDYDKYEHELLKHHLGTAESTTTLGLKDIEAEFNRRVPSLTEPTAAEREYERRMHLKAQKARSRRFFDEPSHRTQPHGTHAGMRQTRPSQQQYNINGSSYSRTSSTNTQKPSGTLLTALAPRTTSLDELRGTNAEEDVSAAAAAAATSRQGSTMLHHTASALSPTALSATASQAECTGAAAGQGNAPRAALGQRGNALAPIARSKSRSTTTVRLAPAAGDSAAPAMNATRRSPGLERGSPSLLLPPSLQSAHNAPTAAATTAAAHSVSSSGRGSRSLSRSATRKEAAAHARPATLRGSSFAASTTTNNAAESHRSSPAPLSAEAVAEEVQRALRESAPQVERLYAALPEDLQANNHSGSAASQREVSECAEQLRILLRPPPEYVHSFSVDLNRIDLRWLLETQGHPRRLVTLRDWLVAAPGNGGSGHAGGGGGSEGAAGAAVMGDGSHTALRLNSPRSTLVLLRNGVQLSDLEAHSALLTHGHEGETMAQLLPPSLLQQTAEGAGGANTKAGGEAAHGAMEPKLREALQRYRASRDLARRQQLSAQLLSDYATLCSVVPLQELLHAVRQPSADKDAHTSKDDLLNERALPSTLQEQQARQERALQRNRAYMSRQVELAKATQERERRAQERQAQLQAEAREMAERKAAAEAEARLRHQQRFAAAQESLQAREQAYIVQLQERITKAEQRNAERLEAHARRVKARQARALLRERERRQRVERAARAQQEAAAQLLQRRLAKEADLERIRREREERVLEEHAYLKARQERAEAARLAARQRAAATEQLLRQAAVEKQNKVAQRLQAFQAERQEQLSVRAAVEEARAARRQEAYRQANEESEGFKARTLAKQRHHEALSAALQRRRAIEVLVAREHERESAEAQQFALRRRQRAQEFSKVRAVARLIDKRAAADYVTRQREAMLAATTMARAQLSEQMTHLKDKIVTSAR